MIRSTTLAVVGGDERQAHLAALLHESGHTVCTYALERHPVEGCSAAPDLRAAFSGARAVILPLPVQHGDAMLNAPLSNAPHPLTEVMDAVPPGTLVLAGAAPFWLHARAVQNETRLIDYLAREELAIRNAVPTCEGAIQLAMEQTDYTLSGARCLVVGCGRIGAMLARKLRALDANVSASARSPRDLARIESAGMTALRTGELAETLAAFPLIFNTVPAPVFGAAELAALAPGALLIDLASLPGGVAPDAPLPEGCRILHALSLPGRVAPRSAARAIHDTVLHILQEETVL